MVIKGIKDEDFVNYRKPSMFIIFPQCSFKCDHENGCRLCQNSHLAHIDGIEVEVDTIIQRYIDNPLTSAIVCGGPVETEYTRIVGFYTPIKTWSKTRKEEYAMREWERV